MSGPHAGAIHHPRARPLLLLDSTLTTVNGLLYLAAANPLSGWFGAPVALLREVGLFLIVVGLFVAYLATRRPIPRTGVLALAIVNALWFLGSLGYAGLGDLSTLGRGWVVLQGVLVGGFAIGQAWLAGRSRRGA